MTTYSWTDSGGDDLWSNANNWTPAGGPPSSTDTAFIGTDGFSVILNGMGPGGEKFIQSLDLGFFVFPQPAVGSTLTVDDGAALVINGASNIFRDSLLQSQTGGTIAFQFTGDLTNAGTVFLGQVVSIGGGVSDLFIEGVVTLSGGGSVDLGEFSTPFNSSSTGDILNFGNSSGTLINQNNTISGAGQIILGSFDNQADGTVEASLQGSPLQIIAGNFSNEGAMVAGSHSTLDLTPGAATGQLTNTGTIIVQNNATLTIGDNFTISGDGGIELGPGNARIVSNGLPSELVLNGQSLKGAGTIGDGNLTLDNASGTIAADVANATLTLNTGTNEISNGGSLSGINNGTLVIDSEVDNLGVIEATGGRIHIAAPVFQGDSSAAIDIGTGGEIALSASVAGNVTFTGSSGELFLDANGSIGGEVVGAQVGDSIVFSTVGFSSSLQAAWEQNSGFGMLSLVEGGTTLASVTLAGQYTNDNFLLGPGASGQAVVELPNPNPPAGTTADMIMRDGSNGNYEIYDLGSNSILAAYGLGQVGTEWQVAGLGGFFGTDTSDMMLRNSGTGAFEIYDISNNSINNAAPMGQVGLEWAVSGFGDFSGNPGETDMLMRNSNTGAFEIYDISNNAIYNAASMGQVGTEWSVAGFGDFSTRPNETDMLMRNNNTGAFELYDIRDNAIAAYTSMGQVGLEWSVAGFGDFSGNANETDMLMRNVNTGAFEIYDISNNGITSYASMGQVGLEWQVAGFGAIDGAGASDMLMRNVNTGAFEVYDIANNTLGGYAPMGAVGTSWSVAGIAADPPAGAPSQLTQSMASYAPGNGVIGGTAPPDQTTAQTTTASPLAAQN
jgi:hypothetical protein